jgi:excisionase family DNA binding protein
MAQFYSLDEAARILGMSSDELKAKAQQREIRAFQDRGTWQFRRNDVDELARRRGLGSDPDLSLSDLDLEIPPDSDDHTVNLSDYQASGDQTGSSERDLLLDDLSVPPELTGSSSTIIGMKPTGKQPSDSDVKVVPNAGSRGASDSDVRLAPPGKTRPSDSDVTLVAEGTSDLRIPPRGAKPSVYDPGETTLRPSPLLGSSGEVRAIDSGSGEVDSDSDFELTPSSVIDALQPDSGSDFELTALDASDEFEAASPRSPSDSDVTGALAPASGVNLGRPTDSGINLLGGAFDIDSEDSIELAPLEEDKPKRAPARPVSKSVDPGATALPIKDPGATSLPIKSPGATALPVRGSGEKDIFEDTDFEVDALETRGEDRTMQLEATSDFDLEDSDSSISEVFAVDEDDVDVNAATAMGAAPALDDDEDSGESDAEWDNLAEEAVASPSAVSAPVSRPVSPVLSSSAQPEWGTPWVVALGLATFVMLMAAFVGMDLVSNLNEFRGDGPPSGLVKAVAGLFGGS